MTLDVSLYTRNSIKTFLKQKMTHCLINQQRRRAKSKPCLPLGFLKPRKILQAIRVNLKLFYTKTSTKKPNINQMNMRRRNWMISKPLKETPNHKRLNMKTQRVVDLDLFNYFIIQRHQTL